MRQQRCDGCDKRRSPLKRVKDQWLCGFCSTTPTEVHVPVERAPLPANLHEFNADQVLEYFNQR